MEIATRWYGKYTGNLSYEQMITELNTLVISSETAEMRRQDYHARELNEMHEDLGSLNVNAVLVRNQKVDKNPNSKEKSKNECVFCDGMHKSFKCRTGTPKVRVKIAADKKLCKSCLRSNHQTKDCKSERKCRKCDKSNHCEVLCFVKNENQSTRTTQATPAVETNITATAPTSP